ncbi:MAG: hypothetical protein H7A33_00925 [Deltaproteobacteria bacterium]|nr:hypothetical protein [Deltaproteobacteria bacterium]
MLLDHIKRENDEQDQEEERRSAFYKCAACFNELSDETHLCSVGDAGSPFHSFLNPAGFHFDLITVNVCQGVMTIPEPSFEYSWFPGYAWSILGCAKCNEHVGWKFQCDEQEPQKFYALIKDKLVFE